MLHRPLEARTSVAMRTGMHPTVVAEAIPLTAALGIEFEDIVIDAAGRGRRRPAGVDAPFECIPPERGLEGLVNGQSSDTLCPVLISAADAAATTSGVRRFRAPSESSGP